MLVLATLGAAERRRLRGRRRRPRRAEPEPDPTPVATARATIIDTAAPFADAAAAGEWLGRAGEDEVERDLVVLNRILHTYRVVAVDPQVRPVARPQALVARVGFGEGEEVAYGRWSEARELLAGGRRRRRAAALAPHARLAAVLGGRERPLVAEELTLRARLDLDHGRDREAALQLRLALDAALAELAGEGALAARLEELRGRREAIAGAAETALDRPPVRGGARGGGIHARADRGGLQGASGGVGALSSRAASTASSSSTTSPCMTTAAWRSYGVLLRVMIAIRPPAASVVPGSPATG